MLNTIKHCYENKLITYFYFDADDGSKELCGYISYYNKDIIVISHITANGLYDGYVIRYISDLFEIDYDGKYEERIEKLYKLKKQSHKEIVFNNDNIISIMFDFAKENGYLISLETSELINIGELISYNDNTVTLKILDKYGQKECIAAVNIDKVISFGIDGTDEQNLRLLIND